MTKILHSNYPITPEEFLHRYWELGHSMEQIARDLNGWGAELRRHVLKAGLKLKTKRQAYDDRMRASATRRYHFNQRFFDVWSPEMAWVLGLVASDGCIDKNGHYWQITMTDKDCLKKVAQLIKYSGPIHKAPHTNCHILKINSTFMVRQLRSLGLTPAKSLTLHYPDVPDDMHRHFIRGYFDGDGSIYIQKPRSKNTGLYTARANLATASKDFAHSLMRILERFGMEPYLRQDGDNNKRKFPDGNEAVCQTAYVVRLGGISAVKFYEFLFDKVPDNLSLTRKRAKYRRWYKQFAHIYADGPAPKGHNAVSCNQLNLKW